VRKECTDEGIVGVELEQTREGPVSRGKGRQTMKVKGKNWGDIEKLGGFGVRKQE